MYAHIYYLCCMWIVEGRVRGHITWVYTTTQLGLSGPPEYCTWGTGPGSSSPSEASSVSVSTVSRTWEKTEDSNERQHSTNHELKDKVWSGRYLLLYLDSVILKEKLGNISVLHSQPKVENIPRLFAAWKTLSSSSRDPNPKGAKFHNYMIFTAL